MTAPERRSRGRVLRAAGGVYDVRVGSDRVECRLRGRLKLDRALGRVAVGDEVAVEELEDGSRVIVEVYPRSTRISRTAAHGGREQVIAANVDRLAAVFAVAEPEPQFALLDRFLVLAEASGIGAFLVVNKIDLSGEAAAREQFAAYERIGYTALYTSAKTGKHVEALRAEMGSRITIFAGPSGAGKSSLLNAMQPDLGLRVGEISQALEGGKHTTTSASLHPLEFGGYVVDTPGLRKLELWEVELESLDQCFPEFRPFLGQCRFADCKHLQEPECAVLAGVERGEIDGSRYSSYVQLYEERESRRAY